MQFMSVFDYTFNDSVFIWTPLEGGGVFYPVDDRSATCIVTVNILGALAFEMIKEGQSMETIFSTISDTYGHNQVLVAESVKECVEKLVASGVLLRRPHQTHDDSGR